MKSTPIILSAAWIATIAASFTIGSKLRPDDTSHTTGGSIAQQIENTRSTQRTISRARPKGAKQRGSSAINRAGNNFASDAAQIATIMANDNPMARAESLIALINSLDPNDFEQAVVEFRKLGITRERMSEYTMLLHAWAKSDPLAALDFAQNNTSTRFARQTILTSWAADNPDAAFNWAINNHEGEDTNPWLVGVIRGIAANNSTRATEIMTMLPYSRERGEALTSIIPHITKQGKEKATAWVEAISDERLRTGGAARIAGFMARSNPSEAAEWIMNLSDSESIFRAAGEVAGIWADNDLDAAVAWTDSLSGNAKSRAAREVVMRYADKDAHKASSWLATMPNEPEYESVVTSYIWRTAEKNPELSLAQIPRINNERTRNRYYERIVGRWIQRDENAAQTWVTQQDNMSETMRKRLLQMSQPKRDR